MGDEMNCIKFRELLDGYIDDTLSVEEKAFMKAHAEKCAPCAQEMHLADIIRNEAMGMDDDVIVPLKAQSAWRNAVRKEIKAKKFKRAYKALTSVAASVLVLVGVTFAMRSTDALPPREIRDDINAPAVSLTAAKMQDYYSQESGMPETAMYVRTMPASGEVVIEADGETDEVIVGNVEGENIIRSADIVLESESVENDLAAIYDLTEEYDGYISEDIRDYAENTEHADIVSRIPVDLMDDYISAAENIGCVVSVSRFSQNADEIYYDIDGRLESKILLSEEINRLIQSADQENVLLLNDELNRVYAEIDSLTRLSNTRDNELKYARVKISLIGKNPAPVTPAESTLKDRSAKGFMQSLTAIGDFFQDMVVSVAVIAPVVLILAAIVLVSVFTVKSIRRKNKKGKEEE